jgi:O-antigen ligase
MRKHLGLAEQIFTVVSLLHYSGGPVSLILTGGSGDVVSSAGNDNSLVKLLFFLIYVVTFFLLVARWKKVIYLIRKDRVIGVLMGMVFVSLLWSVAPTSTLIRAFALVGTTLFGIYLATRYSMRQQLQMLAWMFCIAIVLSLLFGVILRNYGVHTSGDLAGNWRGIYVHKNVLGAVMSLSAIVFFLLAIGIKRNRWLLWCGFSFSIILLLLSTSKTSLLKVVQLLALILVCRPLRWRYEMMIPGIIALITIGGSLYVWFTTNAETVLGSIGKDATLTGRTDLWPFVWDLIEKRPWLGYGYSGLWLNWDSETAYVWRAIGWIAPNSHNGFLDLLLQFGILGLSIFLLGFCANLVRALAWVRLSRTPEGFWPMVYMVYTVLSNLTETSVLQQNDLFWVLFVAVTLSIIRSPEQETKVLA